MEIQLTTLEEATLFALGDEGNWIDCNQLPCPDAIYNLEQLDMIRVCGEINYALIKRKGYEKYQQLKGQL